MWLEQLTDTKKLILEQQSKANTVGLIIGCFDILHIGHVRLFKEAKKKVDFLLVGLESDESIRRSKGSNRPVHNIHQRIEVLEEERSIDHVFEIKGCIDHTKTDADSFYSELERYLSIDFLITNPKADIYWKNKEERAKRNGHELILIDIEREISSTEILRKVLQA